MGLKGDDLRWKGLKKWINLNSDVT